LECWLILEYCSGRLYLQVEEMEFRFPHLQNSLVWYAFSYF
jgi:hypothetical protein